MTGDICSSDKFNLLSYLLLFMYVFIHLISTVSFYSFVYVNILFQKLLYYFFFFLK